MLSKSRYICLEVTKAFCGKPTPRRPLQPDSRSAAHLDGLRVTTPSRPTTLIQWLLNVGPTSYNLNVIGLDFNSVKRSDVTGYRFEWQLGEKKVI